MNSDRHPYHTRGLPDPVDDDPYYHIEYCFFRGEDQPTLKVDIETAHLTEWLDQMLRFGGVKIISVELREGN